MNIKFKRLTTDAKIPLRATAGAAGFDVFSNFASVRNQK
jgi:dUTPase